MGKTLSAANKYFNKLPCPRRIVGLGFRVDGTLFTTPKGTILPQNALSITYSGKHKKKLAFIKEMMWFSSK